MSGESQPDHEPTPTLSPGGAGGSDPAPQGPPPDRTLGPYRILAELGRGGMGVVYKAFHPGLKRTVALKVLIAGEDASDEAIARFHREAEAVARLGHHPNIVPVYDIGREGRNHYFAMHFVEGVPLDRLIDDGAIPPRRAAEIARTIAQALHHAHERGILHRDVKPANILLARSGEETPNPKPQIPTKSQIPNPNAEPETPFQVPLLTDFGLAKDVASESRMTRTGMTLGTPQYMPPEQAKGDLDAVDERSDVYSLGATLYEMLCARPPFEGDNVMEVVHRVLFKDPVSPRRGNPNLPRDLETICLKCLEKEPARRYATAAALARDLESWLEGSPIAARPVSRLQKARRWIGRRKAASAVALAAVVAVAAAGIAAQRLVSREGRRAGEAAAGRRDAESLLEKNQEVAKVLLSAHARLGRLHGKLKAVFFDSSTDPKAKRRIFLESYEGPVKAFAGEVEGGAAAQATAKAVQGWFYSLGGLEEEAAALFAEARRSDPDVGWGALFEGMVWFVKYLGEQHVGFVQFRETGVEVGRPPEESGELEAYRRRFEATLVEAGRARAWGVTLSETFGEALGGLQRIRERDPRAILKGLTAALSDPAFFWIEEELLLARAKFSHYVLDTEGGLRDCRDFLDRCPGWGNAWYYLSALTADAAYEARAAGRDPRPGFREAVAHMGRAAELKPWDWAAWGHRAMILHSLARAEMDRGNDPESLVREALAGFDEALRLLPGFVDAWAGRGEVLVDLAMLRAKRKEDPRETYRQAFEALDRAIRIAPENAYHYYERGNAHRECAFFAPPWGEDPVARLRAAVADLDRALALRPDLWEALFVRASARGHLAQHASARGRDATPLVEAALEDAAAVLRAHPNHRDTWAFRANLRNLLARWRDDRGEDPTEEIRLALADCDEALRLDPRSANALAHRGDARLLWCEWLRDRGEDPTEMLDLAARAYDEALGLDPGRAKALSNRAEVRRILVQILRRKGEDPREAMRQALDDAERAAAADPGDPAIWHVLGSARYDLGDFAFVTGGDALPHMLAAVEAYSKSLERDASARKSRAMRASTWISVADLRFRRGEDPEEAYRRALEDADAVLAVAPADARTLGTRAHARIRLAESALKRGEEALDRVDEAIRDYDEALRIDPGHPNNRGNRGSAHLLRAETILARRRDPTADYLAAIRDYDAVLEAEPERADTLAARGTCHMRLGQIAPSLKRDPRPHYEAAVADLGRAAAAQPRNVGVLRNLANALMPLGRNREALASLEKARDLLGGGDATVNALVAQLRAVVAGKGWILDLSRGDALLRAGRWEEARAAYERGLAAAREAGGEEDGEAKSRLAAAHYNLACVRAREAGAADGAARDAEVKAALEHLGRSFELGWSDFAHARSDPDLEPLRGLPAFAALLEEWEKKD